LASSQAPSSGIAALDESRLDALIERVEEATEHDLATLERGPRAAARGAGDARGGDRAARAPRSHYRQARELLGIVRSLENLSDLAGAVGGGEIRSFVQVPLLARAF